MFDIRPDDSGFFVEHVGQDKAIGEPEFNGHPIPEYIVLSHRDEIELPSGF
jgi:hypothetical protein